MVLKMMRFTASSSCYGSRLRGMPCPLQSSLVAVANDYSATFHSRSAQPVKCTKTQQRQLAKVTNLEDAFNVFDEMLQWRPLPSIVRFTQILSQVAKFKHYSAAVSLSNQMGASGIGADAFTLAIVINCFCHLNQMGFGLSVLGKFFKLGFEPDAATFNTLIHGFLLEDRVAEAAGLFKKMMESGNCKPNVITFGTLVKGLCMKGNNNAAIQLLKKMEEGGCRPDLVVYSTIIDSLCKDTLLVDALNIFSEMVRVLPRMSLPIPL
ncbi:hypothetical protein EV2_006552 [Malus domestica]